MEPLSAPCRLIVSVVIPALNEEDPISDVVREVRAQPVDEIIVVDNGSTDRTAARAAAAGARVISEPRRGYGRACQAGVAATRADCGVIVFLDGDGSDCPAFIPALLAPISHGTHDFVIGSRVRGKAEQGSLTPQQRLAGRLAGILCRFVYGVQYTDMSPFRAILRDRLAGLGMREETYGWNLEMQMQAARAGLRILEVPVDHRRRAGGVSKVSGNVAGTVAAAARIGRTFLRIATAPQSTPHRSICVTSSDEEKFERNLSPDPRRLPGAAGSHRCRDSVPPQ
jgi:glycosyltransferase involved in cell wall biosynthesis